MKSLLANRSLWLAPLAYLTLVVLGVALFFLIRGFGEGITAPLEESAPIAPSVGTAAKVDVVLHVAATLAAVIVLGYALGRLLRFVGQPPVIGEVIAGILLGPSLLGMISPEAMHLLIPSVQTDPQGQVPSALKAISQLGIILYLFLVGLELNGAQFRHHAHAAVAISHTSIIIPFVCGALLALGLYPHFSHSGVSFTSFSLFMGIAMSITAFPVLARILTDRGLQKSELGTVALSCAAADDVTAWCLLALVVGVAQSQVQNAVSVVIGSMIFLVVMLSLVRPIIRHYSRKLDASSGPLPSLALTGTFVAILLASICTEAIGVHAVFGAFLLGSLIPHDSRIAREFQTKLRDLVTVLLLPSFFAYTGMRTQIGLVSGWENWLWCGLIILVATVGKFGGSLIAARISGYDWRTSTAIGTLMNTRGLMELIVLNIGLDLGVLSPTLYSMMVVMALVTTMATGPLLALLIPSKSQPPE